MLRFKEREGETFHHVRERMWDVIKKIAAAKHMLPSTKETGEEQKPMWASFVKTKAARAKSSLVSMVRRVTCALALDAKTPEGGVKHLLNTQFTAYDCDWSLGTIWCGEHKLASATHKAPQLGEHVLMSGGWVSLDAVSTVAGCTIDEAKAALERELDGKGFLALLLSVKDIDGEELVAGISEGKKLVFWMSQPLTVNFYLYKKLLVTNQVGIKKILNTSTGGVAVGFALDKFDCVIKKIATRRGIWVLARIKNLGRVVCGSLHAHTGVTNAIYQAAIHEFFGALPRAWRQYPLLCGVDANETPRWITDDGGVVVPGECSSNLNVLLHEALQLGCKPCAPKWTQRFAPTHFPRDSERTGRQIDLILCRQVGLTDLVIDAERRHCIGSDHAFLFAEVWLRNKAVSNRWGNDSRARWVVGDLPEDYIIDDSDLTRLALAHSRPRKSNCYVDNDEIKQAIVTARSTNNTADWKRVHRLRTTARKEWKRLRLQRVLAGDWGDFRQLQADKKRRRGWWGDMLEHKTSTALSAEVQTHLRSKMVDPAREDWDEELSALIRTVPNEATFVPFEIIDVRSELQGMRCKSAVGPDLVGVHLLRTIASHDHLGPQLLDLINHIVRTHEIPLVWEKSFLALLAKVDVPTKPGDLRPIAVSSAFNKLVNRLVCSRALPLLRRGSRISACGRGRQAADLIGVTSRVRDVVKEWKLPAVLCKLDVAGAFDRIDRRRVAALLSDRLGGQAVPCELRYLLSQLRCHTLEGRVPGGDVITIRPNNGIKQGAPESAEVFGLVIDALLSEVVNSHRWKALGASQPGLDIEVMFYQDDIFVLDHDLGTLGRRVRIIHRCLQRAGLKLATNKTKIIASPAYKGSRHIRIGDDEFVIAGASESIKVLGLDFSFFASPSQQAQELLSRTRAAAASHRDILTAKGPWSKKLYMMKVLVDSQFTWTGGTIHWSQEDLRGANLLQLHTLRSAFGLKRLAGESWSLVYLLAEFGDLYLLVNECFLLFFSRDTVAALVLVEVIEISAARFMYDSRINTHVFTEVNAGVEWCQYYNARVIILGSRCFGNPASFALLFVMAFLGWLLFVSLGGLCGAGPKAAGDGPVDDGWEEQWQSSEEQWPAWCLFDAGDSAPSSSWQSSCAPSSSSVHCPLTHAQRVAYMSAAWDEEISLGIQLEENSQDVGEQPLGEVPDQAVAPHPAPHEFWIHELFVVLMDVAFFLFGLLFGLLFICLPTFASQDGPGRDRWHNPDGSLVHRTRQPPDDLNVAAASHAQPMTPALPAVPENDETNGDEAPFTVTGSTSYDGEPVLHAVTFYGREFLVKCNGDEEAGESTTAGEDSEDLGETNSSEAMSSTVGFWQHGSWHARSRTPAEQRAHVGGAGPRRTQRRRERVERYLRGEWRPSWLEDYIVQKQQRDKDVQNPSSVSEGTASVSSCPPGTSAACEPSSADSAPLAETQEAGSWTWHDHYSWASSWSDPTWSSSWNSSSSSSWWTSWQHQWGWNEEQQQENENDTADQHVEEWPWPGDTTTSTTSSSSSLAISYPPNYGLFPAVRDLEPDELAGDEVFMMQLTNSERALLQERGVPNSVVGRIETMLNTMDRQQQEGRGAEGRWALGCFLNRATEGLEAMEQAMSILQRRLLPRGYLPLRRVPRQEMMRWSLFQWARNQRVILEETLGRHLDVGLLPADSDMEPGEGHREGEEPSPASVVATEAAPSSPREAVSITPTTSAREGFGRVTQSSSDERTSDFALNSDGEMEIFMVYGGNLVKLLMVMLEMKKSWLLKQRGMQTTVVHHAAPLLPLPVAQYVEIYHDVVHELHGVYDEYKLDDHDFLFELFVFGVLLALRPAWTCALSTSVDGHRDDPAKIYMCVLLLLF
ncbi:unnamed protein product [Symbiodinium sp. CCMP2592]|nr:unnamed protein product [Symbiodinium sp. CCMP2592]